MWTNRLSPRSSKPQPVTKDKPRSSSSSWTIEEDDLLRDAVFNHGGKKWKTISAVLLNQRSPTQCNTRWNELQNLHTAVKIPWSSAEDNRMVQLVERYGAGRWAVIASHLPGRNGKQCRERWHNQLNPAIKKDSWTPEEDQLIIELQAKHGNAWAKIADQLDGRTDNAVKNRWHSSLLKTSTRRVSTCSKRQQTKKRAGSCKKPRRAPSRPRLKRVTPAKALVAFDSVSSPTAVDAILQETGSQLSVSASLSPIEPQSSSASIKMKVYEEAQQQLSFHDLLAEHTFGVEGMVEVKSEVFQSFELPDNSSSYSPLITMLLSNECLDGDDDSSIDSSKLDPFPFVQCVPSMDEDLSLLNAVWKGEVASFMDAVVETEAPSALVDQHEPSSALCLAHCEVLSSSAMTPFAISDAPTLYSGGYSFPMLSHTDNVVGGVELMTSDYGDILL